MNFNKYLEQSKNEMVENARHLIRIKSIQGEKAEGMPFGKGMNEALEYVLGLASDMGFKVKNIDGYCGYAELGEGDTYIGIFGHVDIYGSDSYAWKYGLYDAVLENGKIYGNGALDKGGLISLLYGFKAIKESNIGLKKKVRLIVGTDEGKRYQDIARYLKEESPPIAGFTTDGYFPVVYAEKGLALFDYKREVEQGTDERIEYIKGGITENVVPGYCCAKLVTERKEEIVSAMKSFINENRVDLTAKTLSDGLLIESFGVEYHCMAIERGENSITQMINFLSSVNFGSSDIQNTLTFFSEKMGFEIYGESLGIAIEDSFSGKLTFNLGFLNFEENLLHIRCDCRFPVVCDFEHTASIVSSTFEEAGFFENEHRFWNPTYKPRNHFLIKTLLQAYRSITKDKSEPVVSTSISYATEMPNVAAFGVMFPGEREVSYQANEFVDTDNMLKAANIYAEAISLLASS
ncbi:MAG: Sapep family Mn(2+)-dependent dipeptidase [Anaerovoracaceae bacterium]